MTDKVAKTLLDEKLPNRMCAARWDGAEPIDEIEDLKLWLRNPALHAAIAALIAEAEQEIERLSKLVYVPGLWRCAKCNFQLMQANLNAGDGSVTARDQPGDKCPNCNGPLWRVTEREAVNDIVDRYDEQIGLRKKAEAALAAAEQQRQRDMQQARLEERAILMECLNGNHLWESAVTDDSDPVQRCKHCGDHT